MPHAELKEIAFQCPRCGHDLVQTVGQLKQNGHMTCPGCNVGINIDTDRLAVASEEIQKALDMVPPEITIKFFRQPE
jgi:transcription elongation factor Elf1